MNYCDPDRNFTQLCVSHQCKEQACNVTQDIVLKTNQPTKQTNKETNKQTNKTQPSDGEIWAFINSVSFYYAEML